MAILLNLVKSLDWSIAFKVLIEDKGISEADKIHYLKRYVGGSAKEAISGYFLLQTHLLSNARGQYWKKDMGMHL